jgi:hypothetical protein
MPMKSFPLNKAFTFLEPGPVILVSTAGGDKPNVMTLSWTMVLDFIPRFAFMTGPWNYSYKALSKTRGMGDRPARSRDGSNRWVNRFLFGSGGKQI